MKKYFNLTVDNSFFGKRNFLFHILNPLVDGIIAEDDCSNSIIETNEGIFLYIHEEDEDNDHVKLSNNLEDFYKNIEIYDQDEFNRRYISNIDESEKNQYNPDDILPCSIYTNTFVKHLGGKRIIPKYKEGSYYNISQAYIDGTITKEEFILLSHL